MYQVGTAIEFTAQHIMHGLEGSECEIHEHNYRLEVVGSGSSSTTGDGV